MTEQELSAYIQAIRPADEAAMEAARRRQAQLAKPPGSLGQLEEISIRLAGVTGQVCPAMGKCRVAVFAADNGVVAEGVSCTPPAVTMQQAVNMTFRKTGMSAMAAAFGDDVSVVDVGIDGDVPPVGVLDRKGRRGGRCRTRRASAFCPALPDSWRAWLPSWFCPRPAGRRACRPSAARTTTSGGRFRRPSAGSFPR